MPPLISCAAYIDERFKEVGLDVNETEPTIISAGSRAVTRPIILR
jgi:hypothetical protein